MPLHTPLSSPPVMTTTPDRPPPLLDTSVLSISSSWSDLTPSEGVDENIEHEHDDNRNKEFRILLNTEQPSIASKATTPPPVPHLKLLLRPRSYQMSAQAFQAETLNYIARTPSKPKPPLKIFLALTPCPASAAENSFFLSLGARFCADFSAEGEQWACVSLYAHLRAWMEYSSHSVPEFREAMEVDGEGAVGIGSIHPYALRAKLAEQREVQWRLGVPILLALIERQVRVGGRAFVVCGLGLGDLEGVRAFGEKVSI